MIFSYTSHCFSSKFDSMATFSVSLSSATQLLSLSGCKGKLNLHRPRTNSFKPKPKLLYRRGVLVRVTSATVEDEEKEDDEDDRAMSTEALNQFVNLNEGLWNGSFYQYDGLGNVTQCIDTNICVTSYGEDELVSLMQTLKIKQAPSKTKILGGHTESEWEEYRLRETNMFTVDKQQEIGFFPEGKAFSLRHQTAEMVDRVLRVGVLGEDDTNEEFPKNLKVPPRRPSIVCESCLYSMDGISRMRAFHILNQRGVVDMIGVFHEKREREMASAHTYGYLEQKNEDRINALLGRWSGRSVTRRSGFYGATIAEADINLNLQMDVNGGLTQDINSTSGGGTSVHWTGNVKGGLVTFDGGFQMTLLPGGMYLASPVSVAKSVAESQSFFLEFSWMQSPDKRRRLVRTYDAQGLVVSTTYVNEVKV